MKGPKQYIAISIMILWATAFFIFFQWGYIYHLAYRVQTQLFIYSSDYLSSYLVQPAWLACLAGDFLTQFFFFNYGGALTITLTLIAFGWVFYIALGKFYNDKNNNWWQFVLMLTLMIWEFLRSCGINYELSSTISLIGGLSLFLIYALIPKSWRWSGLLFLLLSYWLFGSGIWVFSIMALLYEIKLRNYVLALFLVIISSSVPALLRQTYHLTWEQAYKYPATSLIGKPDFLLEKVLAMSVESTSCHWAKVAHITEETDLKSTLISYFYNLSHAMQGSLPEHLMNRYQPGPLGLFIQLKPSTPILSIWSSNEVWFQLGDMTMAEHSAILGMIFSPRHRSARMVMRLAEINMINGDTVATQKYLTILQKTWLYKNWATQRLPGKESNEIKNWLALKRAFIPTQDTLRTAFDYQRSLRTLLKSNPNNKTAMDYLFCFDLLSKDIEAFMTDYNTYNLGNIPNRLYCEALIIGLINRKASLDEVKRYFIYQNVLNDYNEFLRMYEGTKGESILQSQYGKTYWFYYHFAKFKQS
jgi:hypothetical protein